MYNSMADTWPVCVPVGVFVRVQGIRTSTKVRLCVDRGISEKGNR